MGIQIIVQFASKYCEKLENPDIKLQTEFNSQVKTSESCLAFLVSFTVDCPINKLIDTEELRSMLELNKNKTLLNSSRESLRISKPGFKLQKKFGTGISMLPSLANFLNG